MLFRRLPPGPWLHITSALQEGGIPGPDDGLWTFQTRFFAECHGPLPHMWLRKLAQHQAGEGAHYLYERTRDDAIVREYHLAGPRTHAARDFMQRGSEGLLSTMRVFSASSSRKDAETGLASANKEIYQETDAARASSSCQVPRASIDVDEAVQQLLDSRSSFDSSVYSATPQAPDTVFVFVPECTGLDKLSGTYKLVQDSMPNGFPLWQHTAANYWLCTTKSGSWGICGEFAKNENFNTDAVYISCDKRHTSCMPTEATNTWKYNTFCQRPFWTPGAPLNTQSALGTKDKTWVHDEGIRVSAKAIEDVAQVKCVCGHVMMLRASYCRKCGQKRQEAREQLSPGNVLFAENFTPGKEFAPLDLGDVEMDEVPADQQSSQVCGFASCLTGPSRRPQPIQADESSGPAPSRPHQSSGPEPSRPHQSRLDRSRAESTSSLKSA